MKTESWWRLGPAPSVAFIIWWFKEDVAKVGGTGMSALRTLSNRCVYMNECRIAKVFGAGTLSGRTGRAIADAETCEVEAGSRGREEQ